MAAKFPEHVKKNTGRPPKFLEARRPITVTLPERTLKQLEAIHPDRAQAIVKAVAAVWTDGIDQSRLIKVVNISPENAIILTPPCKALQRIPFLSMLEVFANRYLLAIPSGTAVESLEVALMDLLDNLPEEDQSDRPIIESIKSLLRAQRHRKSVAKAEILFVDAIS